jgi:catechol 2,3-dioxygenase-like lactoylglutathione lyase family enzyme
MTSNRNRPVKPRPFKVRAVDFVMYNVKNMKRSRAFYRGLLGLKRGEEYNEFWSEFSTQPVAVALCSAGRRSKWFGPGSVALAVDDVYASVDYLRAKGVKILAEPVETSVCYMAFVEDPDGNRVCIHARKDGTAG